MSITRRRRSAATDGVAGRSPAAGRVRGWRRIALGGLVAAAGTAALSLAGPFALRPFVAAADAAGSAGKVSVAFVLDFDGPSADQVVGCVTVPASDTRYDALAAFVQKEGLTQPVYAPSGLLCSINGIPSSGCGQIVGRGYIYWAYFTGGARGWTYASTGASGTVGTDDVEGWRFENPGSGNPADPGPRTAPTYDSICSVTPPTTVPTGGSGGSSGGGGGQGSAPATTNPPTQHGTTVPTSGGSSSKAHSPTTSSTAPSTTTSSTAPSTTTSTPSSDTSTSSAGTSVSTDPTVGVALARHDSSGGSGPGPGPMIIGGLLIAAVAVAGYLRWRKRPHTP
jgi:hypothetical protein